LLDVQLVAISAFCLIGVGVLAARRQVAGRPLRRSVSLLVDAFALGLVMIAALFLTGAFKWPYFETIRRATFLIIGLAPAAFLVGLLSARLARLALADCCSRCAPSPRPPICAMRWRARCATRRSCSPTGCRSTAAGRTSMAARCSCPGDEVGRATTLIDRDGARMAALVHDASLREEPALLDAVSAAAGIALENARLHAELAARLDELRGPALCRVASSRWVTQWRSCRARAAAWASRSFGV
jgi:hypothetical protein